MLSSLRVNVFPGGFNWPLFAGIETGTFARENIRTEVQATTGSVAQMTGLAAGDFEIAITAFDNVVAYVEGQGEAPIGAQPEFFAFLGSDNSFLRLVAQSDISGAADVRGRSVSVDAATTGYAFALFDLLASAGLNPGDYTIVRAGGMAQRFADLCRGNNAATLLSAPYDLLAERAGLRVVQHLEGPYQGNVGAARRDWAARNPDLVAAFTRAYVAAIQWLYAPSNKTQACNILVHHVPGMTAELAQASYDVMLGPIGFFRDGRLQEEGVTRVLRLRSRYVSAHGALTDPGKYIDLRYWASAQD